MKDNLNAAIIEENAKEVNLLSILGFMYINRFLLAYFS